MGVQKWEEREGTTLETDEVWEYKNGKRGKEQNWKQMKSGSTGMVSGGSNNTGSRRRYCRDGSEGVQEW